MKRTVLSRYERTASDKIIIDVAASQVEELYEDYDKCAPYIRRDLDQNLVDYLIDCAKEIRQVPFVIRFTLSQPPDNSSQARIGRSVDAYFQYLAEVEQHKIMQLFRRSAILFSIGLAILFLSVFVNQALGEERSVVANVFAEGLTIAAWVSMWESLAIFLIEWPPHRKNIHLYRKLAATELIFRPEATNPAEASR